jgi:hypothetical protein
MRKLAQSLKAELAPKDAGLVAAHSKRRVCPQPAAFLTGK